MGRPRTSSWASSEEAPGADGLRGRARAGIPSESDGGDTGPKPFLAPVLAAAWRLIVSMLGSSKGPGALVEDVPVASAKAVASPGPSPDGATLELQMMPHEGRIYLDRLASGRWLVTDLITHEKRYLPEDVEECSLLYDEEAGGRAALIVAGVEEGDEDRVLLVEDIMEHDIATTDLGERYMVSKSAGAERLRSLDNALSRHLSGEVQLDVLGVGNALVLPVCVMKRPRECNVCVFFDCHAIYSALRLTSYKGVPSRWFAAMVGNWSKVLHRFAGRHFLHSKHLNLGAGTMQSVPWYDRCLPVSSMSSVAVVV